MAETVPHHVFYEEVLRNLLERGVLAKTMTVLVICGDQADKEVFQGLGFDQVTISNLDLRIDPEAFQPYRWSYQDAERLSFENGAFDLVVASAGLHHCHSPHRALLEMYRVARRCALVIEARDGWMARMGVKLGAVDEFEITSVVFNDLEGGGVSNTPIPNYIYRWTEREIIKTIASYAPYTRPQVLWYHKFAAPFLVLKQRKSLKATLIARLAYPLMWLFTKLFPTQCNLIGFAILKPNLMKDLHPWLRLEEGKPALNEDWVRAHFKAPKS